MKRFFTNQQSSYTYLNVTQFLSALNDNIFKFLIVYFCIDIQGVENSTHILATAGACFVMPFLLLSSTSGTLADRFSKRNVIVATRILEVVIMSFGVLAFSIQSPIGAYVVLFLMATQSALFGPSKYGIIPELVESEKITKANGLLTCFTFVAIIVGTFLASFITEITARNFIFAALFCTVIAVVGMFTSFCIEYTPPSGSQKKLNPWFLQEVYKTTKQIKQQPSLLAAILGSAYFLFAGAFIQLNIVPFAIQSLQLTDVQGGYLFLLTALGIGAGSMAAGRLSGNVVELGLVPLAGIGMTIGCLLLDLCAQHLFLVIPLVVILGALGGIFLVPLDAYTQVASPPQIRGQVVATTNFFGFLGVLFASLAITVISDIFGLQADKGFSFLGYLNLAMTAVMFVLYYDYVTRYLAMIASRLHFKIKVHGREHVSNEIPSLFICNHTTWDDTLLMLGAQRTRIRFFVDQRLEQDRWGQKFFSLLKSVDVPSIELINGNDEKVNQILRTLEQGISVCLFVGTVYSEEELERLKRSFQQFLQGTPYTLLRVTIAKGGNIDRSQPQTQRFFRRLRSPASVSFAV